MSSRTKILVGVMAVVAVVGAATAFYLLVLRDDAPPPVSITDAVESAGDTTTTVDPSGSSSVPSSLDGTWTLTPGDGTDAGSFAGYRVREELASIGANTATGRTGAVTGSLTIEGTTVDTVDIEVDMTQLTSDEATRDNQMRRQALETTAFPTATFSLTEPVELDAVPVEGEPVEVPAVGELTLHGVTKTVEIPIQAQLVGGRIAVVGSLPIVFADYDIDTPQSFVVLSVEDRGEMEFQLFFDR